MKENSEESATNQLLRMVDQLFGVSWDRAVQWVVVGAASAWFWFSVIPLSISNHERSTWVGPISWYINVAHNLVPIVPGWVADVPDWFSSPHRIWLEPVLTIIAAVCATCLARNARSSGLVLGGVLSLLFAIQVGGGFTPVSWAFYATLVPLIGALGIGVFQHFNCDSENPPALVFRWSFILIRYGMATLSIFWQPFAAPALALVQLTLAYGVDVTGNEATNLTTRSMLNLHRSGRCLSNANAGEVLGALAGILLADKSVRHRRDLASALQFALHESAPGAIRLDSDRGTTGS